MMPYIIILKVRKLYQPTASRFSIDRQNPVGRSLNRVNIRHLNFCQNSYPKRAWSGFGQPGANKCSPGETNLSATRAVTQGWYKLQMHMSDVHKHVLV